MKSNMIVAIVVAIVLVLLSGCITFWIIQESVSEDVNVTLNESKDTTIENDGADVVSKDGNADTLSQDENIQVAESIDTLSQDENIQVVESIDTLSRDVNVEVDGSVEATSRDVNVDFDKDENRAEQGEIEDPVPTMETEVNEVPNDVKKRETTDENDIRICFDIYTADFGKTLAEFKETFNDVEYTDGWLGCQWYSMGNKRLFGFYGYDETGIYTAAMVPLMDIYPDLIEIANSEGVVSKHSFENYIQKNVELENEYYEEEFASPYLYYKHDELFVQVFCDMDGNINVERGSCMFSNFT